MSKSISLSIPFVVILLLCQTSLACLFCKDFFETNQMWRITTEQECAFSPRQYYFNCLGFIQCDKLPSGQYNATLQFCPQTSNTDLSGFDPDLQKCSPDYKCTSMNLAVASEPTRMVPERECKDGRRIHETSCKKYYTCGEKKDGMTLATLRSCEDDLGKQNVRFNPVLLACEEGEFSTNWECSK